MLQGMLPENTSEANTSDVDAQPIQKETQNRQATPSQPKRMNRFDSMPEKTMHQADTLIDKKLNIFPPSVRNRGFNLTKVTCRVCGKVEEVSPNLLFDEPSRYKCNKCARNAG